MKRFNFLLITSLLLFFGLFLIIMPAFADNAYFNKSSIHVNSGSDTNLTEYTSDEVSSYGYLYTFGPSDIYNINQKAWSPLGDQPLTVDTFDPANNSVNTKDLLYIPNSNISGPYYGPGYYMFKIEYPTWTTDTGATTWDDCAWTSTVSCDCHCWGGGCDYSFCWTPLGDELYCGQVIDDYCYGGPYDGLAGYGYGGDWYINNPDITHNQGAITTAYIPVLLQSSGTVDLLSLWTDTQNWWSDLYDNWLNNYIYYQISYTPILHDGECGSLNNNGNPYPSTQTSATGTYCKTYPPNPLYDHIAYKDGLPFPNSSNPTTPWICEGTLGGGDRVCAAKLKVNGACNTSLNGQKVPSISEYDTGMDICSTGTATPVTGDGSADRPWKWGCLGINGGTSTSATACSATIAKNGTCGTYTNLQYFSSAPSGDNNLCDFGTLSTAGVSGTGPWTWKCNSSDGGSQSDICTAYQGTTTNTTDGVCGTSAKTFTTADSSAGYSSGLCSVGNPTAVSPSTNLNFPTTANPTQTWKCSGSSIDYDSPTCTAVLCGAVATPGLCGSANNHIYSSSATTDPFPASSTGNLALCQTSYGTIPASVTGPTTTTPVAWYCLGSNGASNQSTQCTATRSAPVDSHCGTNATLYPDGYPAGSTTFFGTFCTDRVIPYPQYPAFPTVTSTPTAYLTTWTCAGYSCTATLNVNGVCGPAAQPAP